jgi:uncharacterized cupredoxin-like copper-binding protein
LVKRTLLTGLTVALVGAALAAAACGGDDDSSHGMSSSAVHNGPTALPAGSGTPVSEVTVNLMNFSMAPTSRTLAAGKVKFTAVHDEMHAHGASEGGATHQLMVARLPDGAEAGQSKFKEIALNIADVKPGETKVAEAELTPGTYELACIVVEQVKGKSINHYEKGMYTTIVVK